MHFYLQSLAYLGENQPDIAMGDSKAVATVLHATKRQRLSVQVIVRCRPDTNDRITALLAVHPEHTRTGIVRAALLLGLDALEAEKSAPHNGNQ